MKRVLLALVVGLVIGLLACFASARVEADARPLRSCHARAEWLVADGYDAEFVDLLMHDVGCRRPYDIWIPAAHGAARASYVLWSRGVSHAERHVTLRERGYVQFEDGSWGEGSD